MYLHLNIGNDTAENFRNLLNPSLALCTQNLTFWCAATYHQCISPLLVLYCNDLLLFFL